MWKLTSNPPSSNLSMEAKHIISAQRIAKNNLNFGLNSTRVRREKAVSSCPSQLTSPLREIRAVTGSESLQIDRLREDVRLGAVDDAWPTGIITLLWPPRQLRILRTSPLRARCFTS